MVNDYPNDLQREGPNQRVQDLGQLLQDPALKVETEHFNGIISSGFGKYAYVIASYLRLALRESRLEIRQRGDSWPTLFIWCTKYPSAVPRKVGNPKHNQTVYKMQI